MTFLKFGAKFSGGCICYLESKSEVQISLKRRFRIANRIDTEGHINFRLRLSFSERTVANLYLQTDLDVNKNIHRMAILK